MLFAHIKKKKSKKKKKLWESEISVKHHYCTETWNNIP